MQGLRIRAAGLGKRPVLGAVLVLEGCSTRELRSAESTAAASTGDHLLVAVDGGLDTCRAARRRPDLFVGDRDSAVAPPNGVEAIIYPQEKDFSDLAGALEEVRSRGARIVVAAGLLGGRIDHEWGNLLELTGHARHFAVILASTERGTVLLTGSGLTVDAPKGRLFSIFSLGGFATITLRGARWPLERRRMKPGSLGLSNITRGPLRLTVEKGSAALVFPNLGGGADPQPTR